MKELLKNKYPVSKTIRFSLIPVGKTEENFNKNHFLESDIKRAEDYKKVKGYIDRFHKEFIETVLDKTVLNNDDLEEYYALYNKSNKTDADKKQLNKIEGNIRKFIVKKFKDDKKYKLLFRQEIITQLLPEFLEDEDELKITESFAKFTTYFDDFHTNRENMYTDKEQSTGIAYRCVNDNLPKFVDNIKSFEKIKDFLSDEIAVINNEFDGIYGDKVEEVFALDYFSSVLSQSGIDKYNDLIGGYSNSDSSKVKGLNEYIKKYNQNLPKKDKSKRLPLMKPLFKQILSDRERISFIPETFSDDNELLRTVYKFYNENGVEKSICELNDLFNNIEGYDANGIYVSSGVDITNLSNAVFGNWDVVKNGWKNEYEKEHKVGKNLEKFYEKENNEYKKIKSFSINDLQKFGGEEGSVFAYYKETVNTFIDEIKNNYVSCEKLLSTEFISEKRLSKCDDKVELIKAFLDSIKNLERFTKSLLGTGKEEYKDNAFYGEFLPRFENIKEVDNLYNKVRNYITKKPYSLDKIKLNFDNPIFLKGWAREYKTKGAIVVEKENNYYLVVIDKMLDKQSIDYLYENSLSNPAKRIFYDCQKPDKRNVPRCFIRSKGTSYAPAVKEYNLPINDIIDIYDNSKFKKEYKEISPDEYKESLIKLIDYFKLGFTKHESYKNFDFCWKNSSEYNDITEFYHDVTVSCYRLKKEEINFSHLIDLVDDGKAYLFQIYSKDFSTYSKGKENLHTMYFKMLFDERNLNDVVYKLGGGAKMFYRKPTVNEDERVIHTKNKPVKNKNSLNPKSYSVFDYDLIKDKRFTKPQFSIHIPIELNFKADGRQSINQIVLNSLKEAESYNIIGIDRGERNLIYVSVINEKGEIIEQQSYNIIKSDNDYKVDYHELLDKREKERDEAKKSWKTIGNIKELKEGYISQIIHEICKLVIKYDAVIAMEDLNSGFINSRKKVDKQVYQKFENMLITKLNYLVDKSADVDSDGGLLNAYQMTNPLDKLNNKAKQNGVVFYVPAWLTSKIDPTTGFVDLIKPKYSSVPVAVEFVNKIDDIRYNSDENIFEFDFDFSKYSQNTKSYKQKWTVCTNGERINTFRNKYKNNEWDNESVVLTEQFKSLFEEFGINYTSDLKSQILMLNSKEFFKRFIKLISLTLQMRNSITNNVNVDYLISPVKNATGEFFDSRNYDENSDLPCDADANGAYNIARKMLWAVEQIKQCNVGEKPKLSISNKEWLEYTQKR